MPACQLNQALGGEPRSGRLVNSRVDASFSAATREAHLSAMAGAPVDVLVIGGGITGAGVARDAAMRGLRVALVERADFGAGTSSRSSRLVHGGLRYLEHGNLHLVFEASRERRILLRIAPHLVRPRSFVFPLFAGGRVPGWRLAAGLWLYDGLSLFRNVRRHQWLSKRGLLRAEPGLRASDLRGGGRYWDAQCDDARLTLANARDAHRYGALIANYVAVEALDAADGRVRGARLRDLMSGTQLTVHARVTINASGPWSDAVRGDGRRLLRLTKGAHVAVPRARVGNREAITLLSPVDARVMFIVPWGDLSYIGTTDTDYDGAADDVRVSADDVRYLLRSANAIFPDARLTPDDVITTWAGLRPLLGPGDGRDPAAISREHHIVDAPGILSVIGGKLTTYRAMAAELVDRAAARLREFDGRTPPPRAPTHREPLPGGETRDLELVVKQAVRDGVSPELAAHLAAAYGTELPAVVRLARSDPRLAAPIVSGHPAIRAELIHALRREMALTLSDLLIRRTHVFHEVRGHAAAEAGDVMDLVAAEAGWDAPRKARELAQYLTEIERAEGFRTAPASGHAGFTPPHPG
jgi:glycerol-3-phosphate dehydrogenase